MIVNAWGVDRLHAEGVHAAGITGSGVRVAIVDIGSGPHLDRNVRERLGCMGQPCKIGSGLGYDDDNGHGTHVAGNAAAVACNQASTPFGGVVGWPLKLLSSRSKCSAGGGGSYSDIVAALDWLAAWSTANGKPIQVANFSLGSSQDPGTAVMAAFGNAYYSYNIPVHCRRGQFRQRRWAERQRAGRGIFAAHAHFIPPA